MNQAPEWPLWLFSILCFGLGVMISRWQYRRRLRKRLEQAIAQELESKIREAMLTPFSGRADSEKP